MEAGLEPLEHQQAPECANCGLLAHLRSNTLPVGAELAWGLWVRLTGPSVAKFGLHEDIFAAYDLELDLDEFDKLVGQLDAIESGIDKGVEDLRPAK